MIDRDFVNAAITAMHLLYMQTTGSFYIVCVCCIVCVVLCALCCVQIVYTSQCTL